MACDYCTFRRDGSAKPITNEDTRIYLLGGHGYGAYNKSLLDRGLNVQVEIDYAESAHYQDTDVGVSGFNFCPMCGRDLRDKITLRRIYMAALYELTSNYRKLQSQAGETDPEVFNDTMASINDAIEDKAISYAKVINSMNADVVNISEEIKRLTNRRSTIERNIGYMKNNLIQAFHTADINQVKDPLFTVKLSAGRESVVIHDEKQLPVDAFEPQPAKPSKTKIKVLLKKGREVNGAELVRNETLLIK